VRRPPPTIFPSKLKGSVPPGSGASLVRVVAHCCYTNRRDKSRGVLQQDSVGVLQIPRRRRSALMAAKTRNGRRTHFSQCGRSGANLGGSVRSSPANEQPPICEMHFDCGLHLHRSSSTNPGTHGTCLRDVYILVYPGKISSRKTCFPLLEQITGKSKPLLIIADDVKAKLSLLWS